MALPSLNQQYLVVTGYDILFFFCYLVRAGRLELPRAQCPTDFKSGVSTDSTMLAKVRDIGIEPMPSKAPQGDGIEPPASQKSHRKEVPLPTSQ